MRISQLLPIACLLAVPAFAEGERTLNLPHDQTQYLARQSGKWVAIPKAPVAARHRSTTINIVQGADGVRHLPRYVQIRQAYGGVYPYVTVRSRSEFVLISEDADVLVIGVRAPQRQVVEREKTAAHGGHDWVLDVSPKAPVTVVNVEKRLEVGVILPPGVPKDVLVRQDLGGEGSTREATWEVNRKRCRIVTAQPRFRNLRTAEGKRIDVFEVTLD